MGIIFLYDLHEDFARNDEVDGMQVTATEFKNNLGRYLEAARSEDVLITHYGHAVARLTQPMDERQNLLKELAGCLDSTMSIDDAKAARAAAL